MSVPIQAPVEGQRQPLGFFEPNQDQPDCAHDDCSTTLLLQPSLEKLQREALRGVVDTGRYRLPYFVWGKGPPLVFVHGLIDDAA